MLVSQAAATLASGGELIPATGPELQGRHAGGRVIEFDLDRHLHEQQRRPRGSDRPDGRAARGCPCAAGGRRPGAITRWNDGAGDDRRLLLQAQLAGGDLHELRASVPNRPGVVAELALALGRAGVNITDMALYPAADMTEGVVALWIAGEPTAARAEQIIQGAGFPVFRP